MNVVKFPGIGLEFSFSEIAFSIFGNEIYKYAVCIVIGIVVALVLARLSKEKFNIDYSFLLENSILAIIFGTIGARLYYVLFNLDYYSQNMSEIFNFRNGGLAIYGGLIFGALAILVNCKIRKEKVLNFLDYIVPFVAIAQAIGRFGNFFNIEAYGYETSSILRMGIDTASGYMEVHPTFLYSAIALLIVFIVLRIIQKNRKFEGQVLLSYCLLYSFVRAIIEGLRTDSLMWYNFRISQILSILIFVVSLVILIKKFMTLAKEKVNKKEE